MFTRYLMKVFVPLQLRYTAVRSLDVDQCQHLTFDFTDRLFLKPASYRAVKDKILAEPSIPSLGPHCTKRYFVQLNSVTSLTQCCKMDMIPLGFASGELGIPKTLHFQSALLV